ncbi:hypothetical protein TRAPUB_8026 [Trametes pubescens]|uniref:Uncharacterized protein n=1 Tax=Trametes pubescens TaxID=154538 RepID=A0A1M2W6G6_TRAPU|nr:hypothetical protein TRAPUB_8026 [Trametes pubescens]
MPERFAREQQRTSKGTALNLNDEDDKRDDFDNDGLSLDDEDDDAMDRWDEAGRRFGGFEDEDEDDNDDEAGVTQKHIGGV